MTILSFALNQELTKLRNKFQKLLTQTLSHEKITPLDNIIDITERLINKSKVRRLNESSNISCLSGDSKSKKPPSSVELIQMLCQAQIFQKQVYSQNSRV
jgi:hypothetical protein